MSKFLTNINLNGNELQNPVIHNLGTTPTASAKAGGIYFDTNGGLNKLKYYNGSAWVELSSGGSGTWQPAPSYCLQSGRWWFVPSRRGQEVMTLSWGQL